MKKWQVFLTKEGLRLLKQQFRSKYLSAFNRRRIYMELKDARIVNRATLPLNVVAENTKVLLSNLGKRQTFSIRIVDENSTESGKTIVPVTDPIAIALLGYPAGAITEWELEDGINRFQVISVSS